MGRPLKDCGPADSPSWRTSAEAPRRPNERPDKAQVGNPKAMSLASSVEHRARNLPKVAIGWTNRTDAHR
eukprot:scaffold1254_cov251-Pinguiococcus_pyrenoidosus.AAC.16